MKTNSDIVKLKLRAALCVLLPIIGVALALYFKEPVVAVIICVGFLLGYLGEIGARKVQCGVSNGQHKGTNHEIREKLRNSGK